MNGSCGNPCASCGCSPCACPNPTILNQPRLLAPTVSGGTFIGGVFAGPTINGGTATGQQIAGATIDCASQGCTQAPGTSNSTLATTAFVQTAIGDAISATNPDFCTAVQTCLAGSPTLCADIITCINNTPGAISNVLAFDPAVFATSLQVGVMRFATLAEIEGASCAVAMDPCTFQAFLDGAGPNTLWTSFANAVSAALSSTVDFCNAVTACGFAPLASPVFTGDPQAPTAAPGDNDTSIATTAFVANAVAGVNCGAIVGTWTAAVAVPPGPTGFLADDCLFYTVTEIFGSVAAQAAITSNAQSVVSAAFLPVFFSSAAVGNVAATETDAYVHVLLAGRLAANGDAIEFEAAGTFSASASVNKQIRVYFGATIVFDSGLLTIVSQDWNLRGTIVRTAAGAEKVMTTLTTSDSTVQAFADYDTAAENTALAQTIKLTFNGTLANDVVGEVYRDRYVAA